MMIVLIFDWDRIEGGNSIFAMGFVFLFFSFPFSLPFPPKASYNM